MVFVSHCTTYRKECNKTSIRPFIRATKGKNVVGQASDLTRTASISSTNSLFAFTQFADRARFSVGLVFQRCPTMAKLRLLLPFIFIFGLCVSDTQAQSSSSLIVSVSDPNGSIVAAADSELLAENFKQNAISSDLGVISYRGLRSGKYQLTITVNGFKPYKNVSIEIAAGETKRLDVILELSVIEDTVDVSQSEAVDATTSGTARDLKKEEIENLPTDPDELKRVLQALAGPTVTGEEMQITVNGIPGGTLPSKENIKLIRINRNVFSAEFEYSYGGGIQIFTNSDVKKISGWVGFNFSDARFNATNPFIGRRVPSQSRSYNFGFSAPLGKKASFSLYSSYTDSESSSVVNAVVLDPNFNPIAVRESFDTPRFSGFNNLGLNWDPNKRHKFVAQLGFYYGKSDNDLGGFTLESRANRTSYSSLSLAFTETYIVNPDFVNTLRFSGVIDSNETKGRTSGTAINVSEAFLGGASPSDQKTTNARFEIYDDVTRKFGRLNISFGGMIRGYRIEEVSRTNFGGTYTFSGRTAPVLDADLQPVLDPQGNVVTTPITSLESYRRTLLLRSHGFSNAQIRTLGGGADQFTISGGEPEISVSQYDYALYQQNNFSLNETMGVSFGLRYENQTNIENRTNFAPRFGFTWAPKTKPKQKPETTLPRVTVGYGAFYNRFGVNNVLSEIQANSADRAFYFITDPAVLDRFPVAPSVAKLQQGATLRSLRLIDDELRTPLYTMFNINIAKNLWQGMSVNAGYTRIQNSRSIVTRNINAPLAAAPGSTAPPVYPFGNSRNIYETRSEGRGESDRFFVSANLPPIIKFFGKPANISFHYTYAKIRNDVGSGSGSPLDPYDLSREWGPSTADGVHSVFGYFFVTLPKMISIRGDFNLRTGSRFNIITGRDTNRDGIYTERPAFASDTAKPGLIQTEYGLLDPNPAPGDSIIPRNLARGPGGAELNLSLSKSFGFNKDTANKNTPRQRLNFGVWVNNVFNKNNKGNPIGNMSSPNFLRTVSSSSFDGEFRPSNPRRIQFSTSFSF